MIRQLAGENNPAKSQRVILFQATFIVRSFKMRLYRVLYYSFIRVQVYCYNITRGRCLNVFNDIIKRG